MLVIPTAVRWYKWGGWQSQSHVGTDGMQNTFDISSAMLCYFCCLLWHMRHNFQGNDMDASRGVLSGTMDKFKMVGGIDDQLSVSMTGVC